MNLSILERIGLTKIEIKIYLALLKLGQTTTTQIIRDSQINPSKIYESLDRLIRKGLVSYVIKSNKKFFTASSPETLKDILREKKERLEDQEREIDDLIGDLNIIKKEGQEVIHSDIYEGLGGIKSVYDKILDTLGKGETQYIIGVPKLANDQLEGFVLDWHEKRIKKGIKCKYLFQSEAKDYGKTREKMPNTEVKYLPKAIISPMWIEIFGDHVAIGHIKKHNAILFLIHDKDIAKGYLDYFDMIWRGCRKVPK